MCLLAPPFPTSAVLKSAVIKLGLVRYNEEEVKGFLGRGVCEDNVELSHARAALYFPTYLYACVYSPPPLPHFCSPQICGSGDGFFLKWSPFRCNGDGVKRFLGKGGGVRIM